MLASVRQRQSRGRTPAASAADASLIVRPYAATSGRHPQKKGAISSTDANAKLAGRGPENGAPFRNGVRGFRVHVPRAAIGAWDLAPGPTEAAVGSDRSLPALDAPRSGPHARSSSAFRAGRPKGCGPRLVTASGEADTIRAGREGSQKCLGEGLAASSHGVAYAPPAKGAPPSAESK